MYCLKKTNFVWLNYNTCVWICRSTYIYTPVFTLIRCMCSTNRFSVVKLILTCHLSWCLQLQFLWFVEQKTNGTLFLLVYMSYRSTCWPKFISTGIFEALASVTRIEFKFIWKCTLMHIWCNILLHVYYIQPHF